MPEDGTNDLSAGYLQRAQDARAKATCAASYFIMDEYLDIAAAWRALAAEAARLDVARLDVARLDVERLAGERTRVRPIALTPRPFTGPIKTAGRPVLTLIAVQKPETQPERRERPPQGPPTEPVRIEGPGR